VGGLVDSIALPAVTCDYSGPMRFDRMFEDLEGQMDHLEGEQRRAMTEDLTRAERAQISLLDRLRDQGERPLVVHLRGSLVIRGRLDEVGEDWIRLDADRGGEQIWVPLGMLIALEGLSPRARPHEDSPLRPRSLSSELRSLGRDRVTVRVETTLGAVSGRIATVGSDVLDVIPSPQQPPGFGSGGPTTVLRDAVLAVRAGRS
jgi:hypothetical protein